MDSTCIGDTKKQINLDKIMNWEQAQDQMKKGHSVYRKGNRGWYNMNGDQLERCTWYIYPTVVNSCRAELTEEMEKSNKWELLPDE